MGNSSNYGTLSVIDYTTTPHTQGYQERTLSLGATHIFPSDPTLQLKAPEELLNPNAKPYTLHCSSKDPKRTGEVRLSLIDREAAPKTLGCLSCRFVFLFSQCLPSVTYLLKKAFVPNGLVSSLLEGLRLL